MARYREFVDDAMEKLLNGELKPGVSELVTLGLNHEQQHQELLLMDIKNVLSCNPLRPDYMAPDEVANAAPRPAPGGSSTKAAWPRSATVGRASGSTTSSPAIRST